MLYFFYCVIEDYQLDPIKGDNDGNTSLHYAAAGNKLKVVKYLIKTPLSRTTNGATPLHIAAANGSLDVMKYLIEQHHCMGYKTH